MKMKIKNKVKKHMTVVDLVILAALLVLVLVAVHGIIANMLGGEESISIKYVLEVDSIDSEFVTKVAKGDTVYDFKTVQSIGKVSAVSSAQAYHKGTDMQGAVVSSVAEGKSVLYITVEAKAKKTDIGYAVNDTVLCVGGDFEVRLPNLYCNAKCVSIETLK